MKSKKIRSVAGHLVILILMLSMIFSTGVFAADVNDNDTSPENSIGVQYRGHVQNKGNIPLPDGSFITGPNELGTEGEGLRLEGLCLELTGDVPAGAAISYDVHVQNEGWMGAVENGAYAGTTDKSLRIEAIKINLIGLDGYDVYYRGHIQNKGDVPMIDDQWSWVKNGAELGSTGESLRLESIEVKIVKTVNYTALGDSIAYGMSADPGYDYVDLFYNNLKDRPGNDDLALVNLGIPGYQSSNLLTQLQTDPTTIASIRDAKEITISIGGNNLLSPMIMTMATAFNLDPTADTFAAELAAALADPGAQDIISAALPQLQTNLTAGTTEFATDWPQIIATIKALAPQADIYVATLYDPINPQDPLYAVFEPFIQAINATIMTPNAGYNVADVYTAFNSYQGTDPLVNFSLLTGNLDPHPTTAGHALIYQTHLNAAPIIASEN